MASSGVSEPAAATVTETPARRTNWAGNYTYRASNLLAPASVAELQATLPSLARAKAVGTRHSFNPIADSEGTQLDLRHLDSLSLDRAGGQVTVGAGLTYGRLAPWLEERGWALANLASLPHISVAGACATGTHGSGNGNGCLSTAVAAMEWVDPRGVLLRETRGDAKGLFNLGCVHLGAFGVVTQLTLDVIPTYQIAQTVYENLSFDRLRDSLRDVFAAAYSVSLFTDWQGHRATQAWVKRRPGHAEPPADPATFFGATRQRVKLHPLPGLSAENCTEQMGSPGPWHERLPHFRMDYTPSAGAELQTEYLVPLDRGYEAVLAIESLRDQISPHLLISELRSVAADGLAMSMAFQRDSLAIHFTWKPDQAAVQALLPHVEAALEPFDARPHWAKLFTMAPQRTRSLYPRFPEFQAIPRTRDPGRQFSNAYLASSLGG